eukprot:2436713-Amphidinium_carterae.1
MEWPLEARIMWDNALQPGRGRGPTRNLKQLAVRLGWVPARGGWICSGQWFLWDEATGLGSGAVCGGGSHQERL